MFLSICMPTYNRCGLLQRTLDVLLPQIPSGGEVEIIISDNASPDRTEEVVAELTKQYPFICYHRNATNIGADDNAVACLLAAKGEYVWFCSDDDIPLPGIVEKVVTVLRQHKPKLVFLNHTGFLEDEPYTVVYERGRDYPDEVYTEGEEMLLRRIVNHFSATILRRSDTTTYLQTVAEYKAKGTGQGYARGVLCSEILLDRTLPGVCVFVGVNGLAVNNPKTVTYDTVKVVLIDVIVAWRDLRLRGKISAASEHKLANWLIRCCGLVLIANRAKRTREMSFSRRVELTRLLWRYRAFYTRVLPVLLLPGVVWAALFFPVRWLLRKLQQFPSFSRWYARTTFDVGAAETSPKQRRL